MLLKLAEQRRRCSRVPSTAVKQEKDEMKKTRQLFRGLALTLTLTLTLALTPTRNPQGGKIEIIRKKWFV